MSRGRSRRSLWVVGGCFVALATLLAALLSMDSVAHPRPSFIEPYENRLVQSRVLEFVNNPCFLTRTYVVHRRFWDLVPEAERALGPATERRLSWLPSVWFLKPAQASWLHSVDIMPGLPSERIYHRSHEDGERREREADGWTTVIVYYQPGITTDVHFKAQSLMEQLGVGHAPSMKVQIVSPADIEPPPGTADFTKDTKP
jgi:hypothetical protein